MLMTILEGSLAPLRVSSQMKSDGLPRSVHFAFSWQEGIRRPGLKLSTSSLVIFKQQQKTTKPEIYLLLQSSLTLYSGHL